MAARRYEISLRMLKIFHEWAQRTSERFFQHEKKNFLSPSGHVMFYILCKHQWTTKPFHFNTLIVFWCERRDLLCSRSNGDIFTREDNMLFSHVKISSFRAKAHLVFHWCLYNKTFYLPTHTSTMVQCQVIRRSHSEFFLSEFLKSRYSPCFLDRSLDILGLLG